jgi:hypothetical protein
MHEFKLKIEVKLFIPCAVILWSLGEKRKLCGQISYLLSVDSKV